MKLIGAVSTVILTLLILLACFAYVAYQSNVLGHESGVQDALDYATEVCEQGGILLKRSDGTNYYCQRGKNL